MMAEIWCPLFLLVCLGLLAVIALCLLFNEPSNPYQDKVRHIKATEDEVMRQIDETGEYYVGLYRYIARRLDRQPDHGGPGRGPGAYNVGSPDFAAKMPRR